MIANNSIPPLFYVGATTATASITLVVYYLWGFPAELFYLPIIALGILYCAMHLRRQKLGLSSFTVAKNIQPGLLARKVIARYVVWLVVIVIAATLYGLLPFYNSPAYIENQRFFSSLLTLYLYLGIPYFFITLIIKSSAIEDFYDPAIRIIHIIKQVLKRSLRGDDADSILRVFRSKYNRKVLLNLVMRAYFIPLMVTQVYGMSRSSLSMLNNPNNSDQLLSLLFLFTAFLWLIDVLNASLAYCFESRWLENRSRSIDLSFSGWLVCLSCYAPLHFITGYLFPFAPQVANNDPGSMIYASMGFLYAIKLLEILLLTIHIYCDVSLGTSVANITLKRLQTKGPYSLVRHPGTTTKLLLWFGQAAFYKNFWTIKYLYGFCMWAMIYVFRALTEERHLNKFAEYRDYKEKVKYRFIRGIF